MKKHKVHIEIRPDHEGKLDEVVLSVDGRVYCHLEQMDGNAWWMGVGDVDGEYIHVNLSAARAKVHGTWRSEGAVRVEETAVSSRHPALP